MNKKIFRIAAASIIAITLMSLYIRWNKETFFEKTHFADWQIDYPEADESLKFISERAFGNDYADYIIFSSDEKLINKVEHYIDEQKNLIVSEGDQGDQNYSPPYPVEFFTTFSDGSGLEKNIDSYEGYKYWILERESGFEKLGILVSEKEVIFLFVAL
ncbi:hypothetical protein [Proteiniclasticum sp.]|uniref:hypothetical protein n=1 Tax=Proteiniclasticum sp. TaxID=2053595 RepID=UPI0028975D3A|nr:hypothetical protein [Proteiniclasticum sp.]